MSSFQKSGAINATDLIMHRESQVNFNSEVFRKHFEGNIATLDVCRVAVNQSEPS